MAFAGDCAKLRAYDFYEDNMISDDQIAALCDVARSAGADLSADKLRLLPDLVSSGYVALAEQPDGTAQRYKLTPAGQAVLDERGVGANES